MAGLATAAKGLGLKTEGVQVSREALHDVRLPAIGYVNGTHFIEVITLNGGGEDATATIHDPNLPTAQTIPQERLLRLTSGYLLSVWK
jgi:ABC-type bacteriocin/lantibiotic exporter with double-glycine peptidase domain